MPRMLTPSGTWMSPEKQPVPTGKRTSPPPAVFAAFSAAVMPAVSSVRPSHFTYRRASRPPVSRIGWYGSEFHAAAPSPTFHRPVSVSNPDSDWRSTSLEVVHDAAVFRRGWYRTRVDAIGVL